MRGRGIAVHIARFSDDSMLALPRGGSDRRGVRIKECDTIQSKEGKLRVCPPPPYMHARRSPR